MEKAVLVTSFGTSHKDTRQKCLDSIENEVKAKYGSEKVEKSLYIGSYKTNSGKKGRNSYIWSGRRTGGFEK